MWRGVSAPSSRAVGGVGGHEGLERRSSRRARGARRTRREAPRLGGLGGEVEERVEGHEHHGEPGGRRRSSVELGHVADGHADRVAAGLGPQPVDHRRRRVDAVDLEAPLGQREGEAAGPDAELEHRPAAGLRHQRATRSAQASTSVSVAVPVVVDVGEAVAVGAGVVALHRSSVAVGRRGGVDWGRGVALPRPCGGQPGAPRGRRGDAARCSPRATATRRAATRWPGRPGPRSTTPASGWPRSSGAAPGEVVFTSGGTEADNLAVRGALGARGGTVRVRGHRAPRGPPAGARGPAVAPSPSTPGAASTSTRWPPRSTTDVALVSVVLVNNELGTVQALADIAEVVRVRAPEALLHTDAAQALSWLDVADAAAARRPRDAGVAQVRRAEGHRRAGRARRRRARAAAGRRRPGARAPQRHAERRRRGRVRGRRRGRPWPSATTLVERAAGVARVGSSTRCSAAVPGAVDTAGARCGDADHLVPGIVHLCLPEVESEALLFLLEQDHRVLRRGRVELRQRRARAVARARSRSGVRAGAGAGLAAALARAGPPTDADVDAALAGIVDAAARAASPRPGRSAGMTERVLVAMSGGVDSSVAAALLLEAGHDVVGVTLKLWGGDSDRGCCSVADVDDARSRRPAPRHRPPRLQLRRRLRRARGGAVRGRPRRRPHAQPVHRVQPPPQVRPPAAPGRRARLRRRRHRPPRPDRRAGRRAPAAPTRPRTSPTCCTCSDPTQLARIRFPVGDLTKAEVRGRAARLGLRTADKPDSQDVCFITATGGRETLPRAAASPMRPGVVVDRAGDAGRPRAPPSSSSPSASARASACRAAARSQYAVDVDVAAAVVTVGDEADLLTDRIELDELAWVAGEVDGELLAQCSRARRPAPVPRRRRRRGARRARPPRGPRPERRALRRRPRGRVRHRALTVRPDCYSPISSGPALVLPRTLTTTNEEMTMSTDEAARLHLYGRARATWDDEAARTLMTALPWDATDWPRSRTCRPRSAGSSGASWSGRDRQRHPGGVRGLRPCSS